MMRLPAASSAIARSATATKSPTRRVGVIGSDSHGVAEALFIRSYTADVTLIAPDKAMRLGADDHKKLRKAGIECVDGPAHAVATTGNCIVVDTAEGHYTFDSIYPALGSDTHIQLAEMVGADLSRTIASRSTAISGRLCPVSMPPATW